MKLNILLQKIRSFDQIMTKDNKENYPEVIDINADDWIEQAKMQMTKFQETHFEIITEASKDILNNFDKFTEEERKTILDEVANTKHLHHYLQVPADEKEYYKYSFLLIIVKNLGLDSRDTYLELNELVNDAEKNNIDYKAIVNELIPLADDNDKHGMGSIKELFQGIVS